MILILVTAKKIIGVDGPAPPIFASAAFISMPITVCMN
jgi:hypothetical protein